MRHPVPNDSNGQSPNLSGDDLVKGGLVVGHEGVSLAQHAHQPQVVLHQVPKNKQAHTYKRKEAIF